MFQQKQKKQEGFIAKRLIYQQAVPDRLPPSGMQNPERIPGLEKRNQPLPAPLEPVAALQDKRTNLAKQVASAPKVSPEVRVVTPSVKPSDNINQPATRPSQQSTNSPDAGGALNTANAGSTSSKQEVKPDSKNSLPKTGIGWLDEFMGGAVDIAKMVLPASTIASIVAYVGPLLEKIKPFLNPFKEEEQQNNPSDGGNEDSSNNENPNESSDTPAVPDNQATNTSPVVPPTASAAVVTATPALINNPTNQSPTPTLASTAQTNPSISTNPAATPTSVERGPSYTVLSGNEKSGIHIKENYGMALATVNRLLDPKEGAIKDYEGTDDESAARSGLYGCLLAYYSVLGESKGKEKFEEAKKCFESVNGLLDDQMFKLSHLMVNMGVGKYTFKESILDYQSYFGYKEKESF